MWDTSCTIVGNNIPASNNIVQDTNCCLALGFSVEISDPIIEDLTHFVPRMQKKVIKTNLCVSWVAFTVLNSII